MEVLAANQTPFCGSFPDLPFRPLKTRSRRGYFKGQTGERNGFGLLFVVKEQRQLGLGRK